VAIPPEHAETTNGPGPRERVLEAALKLFVEQGYFNTNVPDISKLSRCSVGSIYHHFLNKEEIASHLYRDGIALFRKALSEGMKPDAGLQETIESVVSCFMDFAEKNQLWSRYLWLARHTEFLVGDLARPTTVGFDALGRQLTKMIRGAVRRKEIPDHNAEVIWSIIFGIPLSFVRDWLDGYTKQSPTQVASVVSHACWSALKGAK